MWWWKWRDEYRGGCIPHPPLYKKPSKIGGIEDGSKLSSRKFFTPWPAINNTRGDVLGGVVVKAAILIAARAREFCLVGQRPEWAAWVGALRVAVDESGGGVLVDHGKTPWLAHTLHARTYETL